MNATLPPTSKSCSSSFVIPLFHIVCCRVLQFRSDTTAAMAATKTNSSVIVDDVDKKDDIHNVPLVKPKSNLSSMLAVLVGGVALFSDGYNAQIVGYMNLVLKELYKDDYTADVKTRVSNAFLIGEVFGMLFFGWAIDRLGRRNGIFWSTVFLVLGLVLSTAAHGTSISGQFWMLIIGRGVAGFGAGGTSDDKYLLCVYTNSNR